MDRPDLPIPPDVQSEAREFALKSSVARALQVTQQDVFLLNADRFSEGRARFLYGFTEPTDQEAGFFKMSTPETRRQLERESLGLVIAQRLGIPTVAMIHPYQETSEGNGILHVEKLDAEHGTILTSAELIAGADPGYGARAARAITSFGGRMIPLDIDTSLLNRGDWRNQSAETFWGVWDEQNTRVLGSENDGVVESLLGPGGKERLQTIVDETRISIEPLIVAGSNPNVEYFVHNDTAPNNIFFSDNGEDVLLLDFEHAAASHNLILAQLTDLGNYYGRMWANPEMQQEFLTTYLAQSTPDTIENNYRLVRATAVFGAMFLAKYGMKADHPEHGMSKSLLGNLEENLAKLEQYFLKIQAGDFLV